jgi:hypothetical protein
LGKTSGPLEFSPQPVLGALSIDEIPFWRAALANKARTGESTNPEAVMAARMETRLPIKPKKGPPAICPMASTWLVMDSKVALTRESILRLTQPV